MFHLFLFRYKIVYWLSFYPNRKKIQLSFSKFMAEPTRYIWTLLWHWLQRALSTCEEKSTSYSYITYTHISVGAHSVDLICFPFLFWQKDAMARRYQQHDWQVWCEGSPGLHPHLHTPTAQHIVSIKTHCFIEETLCGPHRSAHSTSLKMSKSCDYNMPYFNTKSCS